MNWAMSDLDLECFRVIRLPWVRCMDRADYKNSSDPNGERPFGR